MLHIYNLMGKFTCRYKQCVVYINNLMALGIRLLAVNILATMYNVSRICVGATSLRFVGVVPNPWNHWWWWRCQRCYWFPVVSLSGLIGQSLTTAVMLLLLPLLLLLLESDTCDLVLFTVVFTPSTAHNVLVISLYVWLIGASRPPTGSP